VYPVGLMKDPFTLVFENNIDISPLD